MPLDPAVIEMLVVLVLLIPSGINDTDCIVVFNIVHLTTKSGPVILVNSIICFRQNMD